jgi:exosortase A-associated hydrolase 1
MTVSEIPVVFSCGTERVVGVLHGPDHPAKLGVLLIVGGPQYRVGSHRQFLLLARALAAQGFACLRFDYRGMGDSADAVRTFEAVDSDIRAAIDKLFAAWPVLQGVVLWGLCDGASAALMYAPRDERVKGIVALNPWVRTEASLAAVRLNHYYKDQVFSMHFWRRLLTGEVQLRRSLAGFAEAVRTRVRGQRGSALAGTAPQSFIDRMGIGWQRMRGKVLFVLSGNDLTAREFADFCRGRPQWRTALEPGPNFVEIDGADHTFSTREWRYGVERATLDWLRRQAALSQSSVRATSPDRHATEYQGSA